MQSRRTAGEGPRGRGHARAREAQPTPRATRDAALVRALLSARLSWLRRLSGRGSGWLLLVGRPGRARTLDRSWKVAPGDRVGRARRLWLTFLHARREPGRRDRSRLPLQGRDLAARSRLRQAVGLCHGQQSSRAVALQYAGV